MLYARVKKICQAKKIPIRQLESDLEFSSGSVCKWDENIPSVDRIIKTADYLGVSLDELLGRKGEFIKEKVKTG